MRCDYVGLIFPFTTQLHLKESLLYPLGGHPLGKPNGKGKPCILQFVHPRQPKVQIFGTVGGGLKHAAARCGTVEF